MAQDGTSPWVWILAGCGGIVLLIAIGIAALVFWGVRTGREMQESIRNPEKRAEAVQEQLGYDQIPEGYQPSLALKIPFVMDLAMLADETPTPQGDFEGDIDRALVYVRPSTLMLMDDKLKRMLDTDLDPAEMLGQLDVRVSDLEFLGSGPLEYHAGEVDYSAHRGRLIFGDGAPNGTFAVFRVKCEDPDKAGFGGWFLADRGASGDAAPSSPHGAPDDPAALQRFIDRFELCR